MELGMVTSTSSRVSRRVLRMPDYIEIFTGAYPSDAEINRFLSRHEALLKQSLEQEAMNI